ncbi:hypothetical protein HDV01_005262 [Terramyces sp. JEL0728]|nr:hypothetical protein HDV01_005262 [Terramyces sp. JEL0728]
MILGPDNFYVYSFFLVYLYAVVLYSGYRWHYIPKRQRVYYTGSMLFYILGFSCCILFSDTIGNSFECQVGRKLVYLCFSVGVIICVLGQLKKVAHFSRNNSFGTFALVGGYSLKILSCFKALYDVNAQSSDMFDEYYFCSSGFDSSALYFDIGTNILVEMSILLQYVIYAKERKEGFMNVFYSLWDLECRLYLGIIIANVAYLFFSFESVENPQFYYSIYTAIPTVAMSIAIIAPVDTSKRGLDSSTPLTNSSLGEKIKSEHEKKAVRKPNRIFANHIEKQRAGHGDSCDGLGSVHATSFSSLNDSMRKLNENIEDQKIQKSAVKGKGSPLARRHTDKDKTKNSPKFIIPSKEPEAKQSIWEKFCDKPSFKKCLFKNNSSKSETQLSIEQKFSNYLKDGDGSSDLSLETRRISPHFAGIFRNEEWVRQSNSDSDDEKST